MPGTEQGSNFASTKKDRALSLAQTDGQTLPVLSCLTSHQPIRHYYYPPFTGKEINGPEMLSHLPKITQWRGRETRPGIQACPAPKSMLLVITVCCFLIYKLFKITQGNSLAVQWLGRHASTAGGMGSIPGRSTKIPQATWSGQNKTNKKQQENYPSITYKYECKNLSQNNSNMKPTEL